MRTIRALFLAAIAAAAAHAQSTSIYRPGAVLTTVAYSATPTFAVSSSVVQVFKMTLTGNTTAATLTTTYATPGQVIAWEYCQDATGGRTVTWPAQVINYEAPTATAGECSRQEFFWDGTRAIGRIGGAPGGDLWMRDPLTRNLWPKSEGDDIGSNAATNNGSGQQNNAIGYHALGQITSGSGNSAIGHDAMAADTSGNANTAAGSYALQNNATGNNNVAIGANALKDHTSGHNNVAVGTDALFLNTTAEGNTAAGQVAGYYQMGDNGTFIGNGSGPSSGSGPWSFNTAVGAMAVADCNDCIVLGRKADGNGNPRDTVYTAGDYHGRRFYGDGSQLSGVLSQTAAQQYTPDGLLTGGAAVWQSGLTFRVSAAAFILGGVRYSSPETSLTLSAANATNPRIDVLALNSSGAAVIVTGTPAASPAKPAIDRDSQLELTFVYVAANATTPANVVVSDVYHENAEWTATKNGTGFNVASTSNPRNGSLDIEGTAVTTGDYVKLTAAAPLDLATRTHLALYFRSKAAWPATRSLQIAWYSGNTRKGTAVTIQEGSFGLATATTTGYQQIVIPLSLFAAAGLAVDNVRLTVTGSGTNLGFYVDDVTLQGGVTGPAAASSIMRGIVFPFDGGGSALGTGKTVYLRVPFACSLANWSIQSTTAETVTAKVWLLTGGTALPTAANSISTAGLSLTTGGFVLSENLADFTTTAIPQDAQLAASLTAVTASQFVNVILGCRQ